MHTKGKTDCKLVIGLMNADEQSLKELQKLLTWLSEGPISLSAQEKDQGIAIAGSLFSRLLLGENAC